MGLGGLYMSLQLRQVKPALLVAASCWVGFAIAGCADHVQITRDPDVRIAKGMTWAWGPAEARATRDNRPVVSRDVTRRGEPVNREVDPNADIVRDRVKNAIAQTLTSKGLTQVSDPATADFLADYHFAVERRNATVPVAYPGGYPGLVCGPYGCYDGWDWGPPGYGYERIRFREGTIVFDFLQ